MIDLNMSKKKFTLLCVGAAAAGFMSAYGVSGGFGDMPAPSEEPSAEQDASAEDSMQENKAVLTRIDKKVSKHGSIGLDDMHIPQYKDMNGVCGIAADDDGNRVAVRSDGDCPSNDMLMNSYGYRYESLTETFRPQAGAADGMCGTAHLVTKDERIGSKDMAKLSTMARGNLESVPVEPYGYLCPTQPELSDMVSNSVGVPVRFEYNGFDANPSRLPYLEVSTWDFLAGLPSMSDEDRDIRQEYSGTEVISGNGIRIPKIMITPESKKLCGDDFSLCKFDEEKMTLTSWKEKKTYSIKDRKGNDIPPFMMKKGAWDVCGGIFAQCDYAPDETSPNLRGTVTNYMSHKSYTSPELQDIVNTNDEE